MSTFNWRDVLTVSVSEMNRAQALDAARQFDLAARVCASDAELLTETDVIVVLNAPVIVRIKDELFTAGEKVVELGDGEQVRIVLPLTHETFNALPMSLATLWISAAAQSNGWMLDMLKKVYSLTTPKTPASQSGSAPSVGLSEIVPATMTTGA